MLIEILLISNMKSVLLYDSYFNNSMKGGGGSGVIPSHIMICQREAYNRAYQD